ncbi:MAG TPA: PDZ domain-containing protein [Candidatus Binatia bacterium]|nr:PDZ domain-containing protein [Candidatus Binatia bacterium]
MKKILFLLLLFVLTVYTAVTAEKIDAMENEIKIVLQRVSPSLVKVVSENAKKYVATGIALGDKLIITTSLITSRPYEKLYVEDIHGVKMTAVLMGQDSRSGLTLLRLEQKGPRQLPQAPHAAVGDWVALVGLFYNRFPAITQGIVSSRSDAELILNAPVAPGSAGGAVVNKKGELLGIIRGSIGFSNAPEYTFRDHSAMIVVSSAKNESDGLCYALPIEKVNRLAAKMKTSGKIVYGWLGVSFIGESSSIQAVEKDSPAQKAGIAKGDRIEEIAGKPIVRFHDVAAALQFGLAGDKVGIKVNRAGKTLRLEAVLAERPSAAAALSERGEPVLSPLPQWAERPPEIPELPDLEMTLPMVKNYVIELGGARQLGIDIMEMTEELSRKFMVKEGYGLLISRVSEPSAAKKAGLRVGDILVRANGRECKTAFALRQAIRMLPDKEALQLELYRDGQARKFSIIPDKKESVTWEMEKFSQKMRALQEGIRGEAGTIDGARLDPRLEASENAESDWRRQKELALLQFQTQSRKLADELRRFESNQGKGNAELKKKSSEQLQRIGAALRKIQEEIRLAFEAEKNDSGAGSSTQK